MFLKKLNMDSQSNLGLKIIFFGTPAYVIPVAQALEEHFCLVGVVTSGDQKVGRKQILTPSAIKGTYQKDRGNSPKSNFRPKILTPDKLDQAVADQLSQLQPDLIVVASYGQIIPQQILDIAKFGALNIHPSLLPKYRGASPIPASILNGDQISGVTIIKMDAQVDHGPIIYTSNFRLSKQNTFQTLSNKMFLTGAQALVKIIPDFIQGKLTPQPQNEKLATYCTRIKKEDGYFDIKNPPNEEILNRMVRAYYPWPNVWTRWEGKIIKLYPNNLVQMEGKKIAPLTDFLRGQPTFPLKLSKSLRLVPSS